LERDVDPSCGAAAQMIELRFGVVSHPGWHGVERRSREGPSEITSGGAAAEAELTAVSLVLRHRRCETTPRIPLSPEQEHRPRARILEERRLPREGPARRLMVARLARAERHRGEEQGDPGSTARETRAGARDLPPLTKAARLEPVEAAAL